MGTVLTHRTSFWAALPQGVAPKATGKEAIRIYLLVSAGIIRKLTATTMPSLSCPMLAVFLAELFRVCLAYVRYDRGNDTELMHIHDGALLAHCFQVTASWRRVLKQTSCTTVLTRGKSRTAFPEPLLNCSSHQQVISSPAVDHQPALEIPSAASHDEKTQVDIT